MDSGDWGLYRREELHKSFLDALMQLGELHFAEARYAEAAEAYQRALTSDNFLEFAHRGLMRCHARQGEAARAVQHYQDLSDLLKEELDAVPSPETTLLYERIRRGDDI
jgi:DNA-binding SARP family transcriptional activator